MRKLRKCEEDIDPEDDSFAPAQYKKMLANIERDLDPKDEHILNSLTPAQY